MIHIGVDLHRRFGYMTALDASGQVLHHGRVGNDATSLRGYFGRWSEPAAVAVEACAFWPAFVDTVEPLVERAGLADGCRASVQDLAGEVSRSPQPAGGPGVARCCRADLTRPPG